MYWVLALVVVAGVMYYGYTKGWFGGGDSTAK
jgi:Flp pilus assembly protein protease CpaA